MESKEQLYKQLIKRKMEDLAKLCYQNNMPCFFVVAVGDRSDEKKRFKNDVGKLDLKISSYLPETMHAETTDTVFSDLVNVTNGFTTVPPMDPSTISFDDLGLPPDMVNENEDLLTGPEDV